MDKETIFVTRKDLLSTNVRDETAILDMASGKYYGLNEVGKRIWELLQTPQSLAHLIAVIVEEFEVEESTCEQDVTSLLNDLLSAGLIEISNA